MIKFDKNFILQTTEKMKIRVGVIEYESTEFLLKRKAELERILAFYPDRTDLRAELEAINSELSSR